MRRMRRMTNLTPKVDYKYGAPLGRKSWNDNGTREVTCTMLLRHIRLDSGGYDSGGAYWGIGQRLYGYAATDDSIHGFVRASDRADAIEQVRALYPNAKFFGKVSHAS